MPATACRTFGEIERRGPVRIAYQAAASRQLHWRPRLAWFRSNIPAEVIEINAAIGDGSDSAPAAFRATCSREPDLVFLECRVNGGGGYEAKSVEGVVRHIWKNDPKTDICFIYTLHQGMLKDLQAGRTPWFGPIQEAIANAYGIPTIDLGVEIATREKEGSLIFKADAPVEGKLVFSKDGVHPGDEGHAIYREIIVRSMLKMAMAGRAQPHALPPPLEPSNWEDATLCFYRRATAWATPVDVNQDAVYTRSRQRTHDAAAFKCAQAGASVTVKWNGTVVGSDIRRRAALGVVTEPADAIQRTQKER